MGYSFLYLLIFLIIIMFVLRIFLPMIIYLIPVFVILWILGIIFRPKHKKEKTSTYEQTYYEDTYQQQSSDPNIIDVDYKVVDEEQNDTH